MIQLAVAALVLVASDGEALDAGVSIDDEVAAEAAPSEVDEVEALGEAAVDPATRAEAAVRATVSRLGVGTLPADRLALALETAEWSGQELEFELAPVSDVHRFDVSTVADRYDIPVEMNELVAEYIHFFQHGGRKWFLRWMNRSTRFIPMMRRILAEQGLPLDTVYLAMIESGFNTQARSWARAVGPWQFIAGTAKMFDLKEDFWVDERRDPVKATRAAAAYLTQLHGQFGDWYLAWAGYNAGGGKVKRMLDAHGTASFWALSGHTRGFARETKHYVPKLIACALVARYPEAFGFDPEEFDFQPPFDFDEVPLTEAVDLEVVAEAAGVPVEDIQELNPELKRWSTPPASLDAPYRLRIPRGRFEQFAARLPDLAAGERVAYRIHQVVKGDTLSRIATRYRSAPEAILRMNQLAASRMLKMGLELVVPVPAAAEGRDSPISRQVARARRAGFAAIRPEEEIPAGTGTRRAVATGGSVKTATVKGRTQVTYGVARGDSLWSIARRFDVHVADLEAWNEGLSRPRALKVGLELTIWPGPAAQL